MKYGFTVLLLVFCVSVNAQINNERAQDSTQKDSLKKAFLLQFIGDGYLPTKYFNFDLRYLLKYNQFEGLRTGLGGTTNKNFSEKFKIKGYTVYGFRDHRFKYSISGGARVSPKRNTWIYASYTEDLEETGSSNFLTDTRLFQLFEPRLLNISLFHQHISRAVNIEHQLFNKVVAETEFAYRNIAPTYDYVYQFPNGNEITNYSVSTVKVGFLWSPFSKFEYENDKLIETKTGYPKFNFQYTKALRNPFNTDVEFSRIDLRANYKYEHQNNARTDVTLVAGIARGDVPLQYLYHAYPNNVNKETILSRFSIAGINSFETMYFNEFFSDRFTTLSLKHQLKPFDIGRRFKPELVLITRMALGSLKNKERHIGLDFNTLDNLFTESGIEINKLLFGFGLSFSYRYGAYHLPKIEDNMALKFTFNLTLN